MSSYNSVPEIVFWHIPSKAYEKVAKKAARTIKQCVGSLFEERVAAQEAEMGMMKLLKERPSVKVRITFIPYECYYILHAHVKH